MKKTAYILGIAVSAIVIQSCDKAWLEPKPLSFFTPENTYVNENGLYSAITACERNMRHFWFGGAAPILTQLDLSDVAVYGQADVAEGLTDIDAYVTPSHVTNGDNGKIGYFWEQAWHGLKYANIVLNRIDCAPTLSEAEKNAIRGQAYFHRAWRYYNLVHEFGDVPWIDKEITEPKLDFFTYDRWSILEEIEKELSFAYEHIPSVQPRGRCNKWGAGVLYMKVLMENQKWDEAIEVGKEIINANPLQTTRLNKSYANLQLDLHSVDAKMNPANTEGLHYVVNITGLANDSERSYTMRCATPYWAKSAAIKTPEGKNGTAISCPKQDAGTYLDNDANVGRGIGSCRVSNYYQYDVWTAAEKNDERGRFNKDSWRHMEDLYYNASSAGSYYGKHLVRPNLSVSDSIRCWWSWPHYKLFVPDPTVSSDRRGGETPWYVYRTAEVYLLVAECYYWKGDLKNELAYLNPVRERAKAEPLTSVTGISEVLAERARELYYEEFRHDELVRIAYTYAKSGKPCEVFNNTVYTLAKFSGNGGDGEYVKEYGYNFYWDWVTAKNGIMNRGVVLGNYGELKMSVHHVLWPIPENAITSNTKGTINETPGYNTPYKRIQPLKIGGSHPASE